MAGVPDSKMEELLAQGDFVRSLARQLLSTEDAEDLVQDTWLQALRRRPRVREPQSWLARIVRRLASNHRRGDRRRARRERDVARAQPTEGPSTTEILACEESRRRVVSAVLELAEPFRATVLARFYECLTTAEIAERQNVAVATVRSRLKRGLDWLRVRLDEGHGGRRDAWATPLALLGRAPTPTSVPGLAIATSTTKKVLVASALLLALAVLIVSAEVWRPSAQPDELTPLHTATVDETQASQDRESAVRRVDASRAEQSTTITVAGITFPVVDEPVLEVAVRVLDSRTRRPVAGAEIVYMPFRIDFLHPSARRNRELQDATMSTVLLEKIGTRAETDASGVANIKLPLIGGRVLASRGDRSAYRRIDPTELLEGQRATIWLEDERWLRIRLVDATSGAPIPRQLIEFARSGTDPVVPATGSYGGLVGPSDNNGMIRWRLQSGHGSLRVRPWTVGHAPWVHLQLPAALGHVTELRCPSTGSLTIELRTPSGRLWPAPIEARVRPQAKGGFASDTSGPVNWRFSEPGIYRVPDVEINKSFRIYARTSRPIHKVERNVAGPSRSGEDVRVVLTTGIEPCEVMAKLLLPDGSPAPADHCVDVSILRERGLGHLTQSFTDADGRVRWIVPLGSRAQGGLRLYAARSQHPTAPKCTWRLDVAARPGVYDLGTLQMSVQDIVAAGTLDIGTSPWSGPPVKVRVEKQNDGSRWVLIGSVEVHPAHDRTFTVRRQTDVDRVRVSVMPARHFVAPEPIVVPTGTRDVQLSIDRGLRLRARVVAPAAYARAVSCRAVRQDGTALPPDGHEENEPTRAEASLVDFDSKVAEFLWPSLPAGIYSVEVSTPGINVPLVSLAGVRLGAGVPADPRLDLIDLRQSARTLTVTVPPLPARPRPITEGGVVAFPSGTSPKTVHGLLFDPRGQARLLVGSGPVDVVVAVPGFRLWRATSVTQSTLQVALESCIKVPFRLAPRVAERFAGHRVYVTLEPRERDRESPSATVAFRRPGHREPAVQHRMTWLQRLVDAGTGTIADASIGRGTVPVSGPGRFNVGIEVQGVRRRVPITDGFTRWRRDPVSPESVVVSAASNPEIVIDVEDEVMTKVLKSLARQR